MREISLKTKGGDRFFMNDKILSQRTKGLKKNQVTTGDVFVAFDLNDAFRLDIPKDNRDYLSLFFDTLQQNCNGSLITCDYKLCIKPKFVETYCSKRSMESSLYITLLFPDIEVNMNPPEAQNNNNIGPEDIIPQLDNSGFNPALAMPVGKESPNFYPNDPEINHLIPNRELNLSDALPIKRPYPESSMFNVSTNKKV